MIYLFTATRQEADVFIREWNLKPGSAPFPAWTSEEITLTVSGIGPFNGAEAVSAVFSQNTPKDNDFLISAGIAASLSNGVTGQCYLINKVTDMHSHEDFYPDLLSWSPLEEASLISGSMIYSRNKQNNRITADDLRPFLLQENDSVMLYDMEGAGIVHAAKRYVSVSQIRIIKAVSDQGDVISPDTFHACMSSLVHCVADDIPRMNSQCTALAKTVSDCTVLSKDLKASVTMERQLEQLIRYCDLADIDWKKTVSAYYLEGHLPVTMRQEGKRLLEELHHVLLP